MHLSLFNWKSGLKLAVITCQVLLISCQSIPRTLAPSGATNLPLQLAVKLTDGTRLIGTTALTTFPLQSEALGAMAIPLAKVRSLKINPDHESVVVSLANGDKLQGSLGTVSLKLQTLLGAVIVPLKHATEIVIQPSSGRLVEWEVLPFPLDSHGHEGQAATIHGTDILLQGNPVRSLTSYTLPLTIDCEFELEERTTTDGGLWFHVLNATDPRDLEPQQFVMLAMGYAQGSESRTGELSVWKSNTNNRDPLVWGRTPFSFEAGRTYQLRWELRSDGMKFTINGQMFDIPNVTFPWEKLQVRIRGHQPNNRWHVRNLVVH